MTYIFYAVLNDGTLERVPFEWADPGEQAGVIDRTLLPVAGGARGWALNRNSGYTVSGDIGSKRAVLVLHDESVPIATLGVCMQSIAGPPLWQMLHDNAAEELDTGLPRPAAPWCALRYDVPEVTLPDWIDWWAKHVGIALATRDGW